MPDTKISTDYAVNPITVPVGTEVVPLLDSTGAHGAILLSLLLAAAAGSSVANAQTSTSYAIVAGDRTKHVTLSNAASIAVSIAAAGSTGFANGWYSYIENIGVGAATITPTTSTVNGVATLVLTSGMSAVLFSDGTNYRAMIFERPGRVVNLQTTTSYTLLSGDRNKLISHSNAASIAVTLPQATGAFGVGWFTFVQNRGAGAATYTPGTSTIDGASTLVLTQGQGCMIVSDGTNYYTMRGLATSSSRIGMTFEKEFALSSHDTDLTTGTTLAAWRPTFDATGVSYSIQVQTPSSSGSIVVDMNKAGTTMASSVKATIDATEYDSATGTQPTMTTTTWSAGDAISWDGDSAGTGARALMVVVKGTYAS